VFGLCVGEMHFLFFGKHLLDQILVWGLVDHVLIKYSCRLINSSCLDNV
jgi:hypothetical protein